MVVGVVVGGLLVVALKASAPPDAATTSVRTGAPVVHVVEPGDTYWSIATSLGTAEPVTETVDELVAANGGGLLQPGDRLVLPR
jgi:LysM repeat protein